MFGGVVSDAERHALRTLIGSSEDPPRPIEPPAPRPSPMGKKMPFPAVELNTDVLRLNASPEPSWVLCLDFGTAKSKAFAATDEEEEPELEPLPLGKADKDLDGSVYEVSSCIWIGDDHRVFVGSEALERGMNYGDDTALRGPLHSLKQEISQVDPERGAAELDRKLPKEVDPTSTLTYADVITIYLAYLTDLATTALERRVRTRYVRRRFTVPSWRKEQRSWAADLIGKSMLRAQLLADTFHDRWQQGIPVEQVAQGVRAAAEHDDKLLWLRATESKDATAWTQGTLEALAAASARVWTDHSSRDVTLVVDVGAGTTDLSLFWVVQQDGQGELRRAWPVADAGIRQAGDTLDRLLLEALLRKAGLGVDDTAGRRARRGLRRRGVRRLKETLFKTGSVTEDLVNDETVTLTQKEFTDLEGVRRFADGIADKIQELLDGVHESWASAGARGITLVLTGGGCDLPMVKTLSDRRWRLGGHTVTCRLASRVPGTVEDRFDEAFIDAYPRLAVAIGGAMNVRLDEKNAMRKWYGGDSS